MLDTLKAIELDCKISGAFEEDQDQQSNPFSMLINLDKMVTKKTKLK